MIIREFDLSVAGVFSLAGCIAVLAGNAHPGLGLLAGLAVGAAYGAAQGFIIARLGLSSVGVTLGGLLISVGLASVLTSNRAVSYDNLAVVMAMSDRYAGIFSIRSLAALVLFAVLFFVIGFTRIGRDVIAAGSNRQAAVVAGVNVGAILVGAFAFSGAMAALGGALLSYSLAAASPGGLADILVPAVAASIIGGVSLTGGRGRPLGIACGVMVLAVLRAGFNATGVESWVSEVATALVLLVVAALDMPMALRQRRQSSA
jgi:ribose/xylose/arabinose/galactoside ABC-type transport system permease subunit